MALPSGGTQAFADAIKASTLWPLSVGKKVVGRYDGAGGGSGAGYGTGSWIDTLTVDAYEKLTTKAGTFDVFVVTRQEESLSGKYRSTQRNWYTPQLGVSVKTTFTDNNGASRSSEAVAIRQ